MPFKTNDPNTIEAAKRGGKTGKKHLEKMSRKKLKQFSSEAGKRSGIARRKLRAAADRYEKKILNDYIET